MRRLTVFLLAMTAFLTGCATEVEEPARKPPAPKPTNVIFILVDTLRADHMSLYGYHRPTTPFLEELANESVVFERARAQAGCTYPSVNSMFTSRYPFDFYSRDEENMVIPEEYRAIAEVLRSRGFTTAAVSASPVVRATPNKHNPHGGFDRGFDVFDEQCLWKPAGCVNQKAIEVLQILHEPFFLYLHYMDPHDPYRPPMDRRIFAGDYDGYEFVTEGDPNPIALMLYGNGPAVDVTDNDMQHLVGLYDDEILYFDAMLGQLTTVLRSSGVLDRSIFVLTSDHGEEFFEHGHVKHCRGVWDTLTRIPLVLRTAGAPGGTRIDSPAQGVDILPTVLDYLGFATDIVGMEGMSLRPVVDGEASDRTHAFADQVEYRSADDGRFHLVFDGLEGTYALYDTQHDPLEQNDLFSSHTEEARELNLALETWLKHTGQWDHFDLALITAKAKEEQLRALGYLE